MKIAKRTAGPKNKKGTRIITRVKGKSNMYNYLDSIKNDIREYLENDVDDIMERLAEDRDELEQELSDELWINDSVTGNASGSYTFNRQKAKENVIVNMDLVAEVVDCFGIKNSELGERFINEDWEYFDVSIRCYLLGQAINEVLNELESEEF